MNQITLRNVFFFDRQLNFNIMRYIMLKDTHTENTSVCLVLHKSPNNAQVSGLTASQGGTDLPTGGAESSWARTPQCTQTVTL